MSIEQDIISLERQFWTGDAEFYRQNLDEECLVAFTEMAGLMKKNDVAGMIKEGQRWRDLKLDRKGLIEPANGTALLTYECNAVRANGEPYRAVVSSLYVKRDGRWKMAFHQQTPLPAK